MRFVCWCHLMGPNLSARCVSAFLARLIAVILMMSLLSRVKTKIQQRALSGTPPRGVRETLRRLVRGTLQLAIVFHNLLTCDMRSRSERPQTSTRWNSTDLPRSWCERGAKHHHARTLVDFFRYHVTLYRPFALILRPSETSAYITT